MVSKQYHSFAYLFGSTFTGRRKLSLPECYPGERQWPESLGVFQPWTEKYDELSRAVTEKRFGTIFGTNIPCLLTLLSDRESSFSVVIGL